MRYTVGQRYVFIHQQIKKEGHPFHMPQTFYPWRQELERIRVLVLTCTEHHKVPDEWDTDNKLVCDGFIFLDDQGGRWLNQYPRASYGQISDKADGHVTFDWPASTKLEDIPEDHDRAIVFELAERSLDTVLRGIQTFKKAIEEIKKPNLGWDTPQERAKLKREYIAQRDALSSHLNFMTTEITRATGAKIDIRPFEFRKATGEVSSYPDVLHAYVTWS